MNFQGNNRPLERKNTYVSVSITRNHHHSNVLNDSGIEAGGNWLTVTRYNEGDTFLQSRHTQRFHSSQNKRKSCTLPDSTKHCHHSLPIPQAQQRPSADVILWIKCVLSRKWCMSFTVTSSVRNYIIPGIRYLHISAFRDNKEVCQLHTQRQNSN